MTGREPPTAVLHVVAAAVIRADGRVLIAQRPSGKHLAGGWEFPGGKLESGETRTQGLARELREELGIVIRDPRPLMRIRHAYPYGEVRLDMWVVSRYEGVPQGHDGQALRWLTQDELALAELLPADLPLVRALRLPECLSDMRSAHFVVEKAGDGSGRTGAHDALEDGNGTARRLRGTLCATAADAEKAGQAGSGWEFLVMDCELARVELERLCSAVPIPVYAKGLELEAAWGCGATGTHFIIC